MFFLGGKMFQLKEIKIQNLILDVDNYRIGHQDGQPQAIKAIIEEQDGKLIALAKDIIKNGLSPIESLLVMPAKNSNTQYVVIEGNRRVTSIKLVENPELAVGTNNEIEFRKLNSKSHEKLPKEVNCVVVDSKEAGKLWIRRRHDNALGGAGIEKWSSTANERADADSGKFAPAKEVREFVVANSNLSDDVKKIINSPKFNNTNLTRLIGTKYIKELLGFENQDKKLVSTADPQWLLQVLSEILEIIATKEHNGKVFSESDIDKLEQRKDFFDELVKKHPKPNSKKTVWGVNGDEVVKSKSQPKPPLPKPTKPNPDSANRMVLIPKSFGLVIPDGKANNIYHELRKLPLEGNDIYPNSAGVLLRVFIEFSIDRYINENTITLQVKFNDKNTGRPVFKDSLNEKITAVIQYMESNNIVRSKELDSIKKELAKQFSILSVATLNAYVHNPSINPKPLELKMTWDDIKDFITKLWS